MMIKYDIQHLSNAQGKGISRPYVQLSMQHLSPPAELEEMAERNTTLTRADMRAALSVVAEFVKTQLARGSRVHLPGLGYFALAASIDRPADEGQQPIKGSDIRVRTVKFKPEAALLELLRRNVGFRRSAPAQVSRKYTQAELSALLTDYLKEHRYITCRTFRAEFQLCSTQAYAWLKQLCDIGMLRREGNGHCVFYTLAPAPASAPVPHSVSQPMREARCVGAPAAVVDPDQQTAGSGLLAADEAAHARESEEGVEDEQLVTEVIAPEPLGGVAVEHQAEQRRQQGCKGHQTVAHGAVHQDGKGKHSHDGTVGVAGQNVDGIDDARAVEGIEEADGEAHDDGHAHVHPPAQSGHLALTAPLDAKNVDGEGGGEGGQG